MAAGAATAEEGGALLALALHLPRPPRPPSRPPPPTSAEGPFKLTNPGLDFHVNGLAGPPGELVNKPPVWGGGRVLTHRPILPSLAQGCHGVCKAFRPQLILSWGLSSWSPTPRLVLVTGPCPTRMVSLLGSGEAINPPLRAPRP